MTTPQALVLRAVGYTPPVSYEHTEALCTEPLAIAGTLTDLEDRLRTLITSENLVVPDVDTIVARCVTALLTGHLVLQGPPGTGKTKLARLLAETFDATLTTVTATADWSTYDVIGGLTPSEASGVLRPVLGCVSREAVHCADVVAEHLAAGANAALPQAHWLSIDELNRADIDKAVGPLYTVLSSTSTTHLAETPLELWFETAPERRHLWLPARFRIVATMNDVDTSFVNPLSQGLLRRFQFVYIGVPDTQQTPAEVEATLRQAHDWLMTTYSKSFTVDSVADLLAGSLGAARDQLVALVSELRSPSDDSISGWPVGSAQLVDLWRAVLLRANSKSESADTVRHSVDLAVADRVVPQMALLSARQLRHFEAWLGDDRRKMPHSARALRHLLNTQATL